jgi:hypothetical protein
MSSRASLDRQLQAENLRLAEQVRTMSGDDHRQREAAPWRDATPEERLAETWRLCSLVPWLQSLWPEEVRARVEQREPLPASALAILEDLKRAREPVR